MREFRKRLIESGLPNKAIEQDVLGNIATEFDVSRQTATTMDYAIAKIDGVDPLLTVNIARVAVSEAASV